METDFKQPLGKMQHDLTLANICSATSLLSVLGSLLPPLQVIGSIVAVCSGMMAIRYYYFATKRVRRDG